MLTLGHNVSEMIRQVQILNIDITSHIFLVALQSIYCNLVSDLRG